MNRILQGVLLRGSANIYNAVANRELEICAARAGTPADAALRDAGFLAGGEAFVGVDDFARAQDFGIDVATEAGLQVDIDRSRCNAHVGASAAPTPRRNIQRNRACGDGSGNSA